MATYIRTGSLGLDLLLGGGWQRGAIHDIWGESGAGKTTLAEHALWELDSNEEALWMSLGTEVPHRPSRASVCLPRNAEQAFYIMEMFLSGSGSLVIVDSANGLIRAREIDGDPDYVPHPQREYKDELNGLKKVCASKGGTVIFVSKPRDKERQPVRGTGISEKARSRVKLSIDHLYQDERRDIRAEVKDKTTMFHMRPGTGIDWSLELARMALERGLAVQNGSWIAYAGHLFHGIEAFAAEIEDNTRLEISLDEQIRSMGNRD